MNKLSEVKWGIIGVGDVCEVKSGPAFQKINNSQLVGVMRRSTEKARDFAARHNVSKWYDDADALINDPDINAIYIATPPNAHKKYTEMIAQAGKVVYVEKPMAPTFKDCLAMLDVCQSLGVPLFVAYYRRCLPNFLKIQELLAKKAIGDIRYVNINLSQALKADELSPNNNLDNWRVIPEISGGGYFHDLACHQLDMMDFLLGPIASARGYSANQARIFESDDNVVGSFQFENKILGQGTWCFASGEIAATDVTTIVGSTGEISFPFFGDPSVTLKVDGRESKRFEFEVPLNIQQPLIQSIVDELIGEGKCPSNGQSAARTARIMDQILGIE